MGEETKIEWCKHTFNPWWGCTKVSAGCKHCYADALAHRFGKEIWGVNAPRQAMSDANWRKPLKWNRDAEATGTRARVFCASMADVFERHQDPTINAQLDAHRMRLWALIDETPHLDWLLLTKRPENIVEMVPDWWTSYGSGPVNVWLGTTVESVDTLQRLGWLLEAKAAIDAPVAFCSYEPALGPVDFGPALREGLDWLIVGGESGPSARRFELDWAWDAIRACREAGKACFVKQVGRQPVHSQVRTFTTPLDVVCTITDRKGGDWTEWPADLRVRQFPRSATNG